MNMELNGLHGAPSADSNGTPVPFDVLRALIAARQSASVTARLMAARTGSETQPDHLHQLIDLFARGRRASEGACGFAGAQPSDLQDEQHG